MQISDITPPKAAPEEMLHAGTRALFRYWEAIRGEMSAPLREALDLGGIRGLVPFLFMIERKPGGGYFWRLAGTRVCDLWGMEVTGKPALLAGERFERDTITRLLNGVIDSHQPFVLRFRLLFAAGSSVAAEFLGLPLRARNHVDTYVFGTIIPLQDVSGSRQDNVTGFELVAARTIWTEPVPGKENIRAKNSPQAFHIVNGPPQVTLP